MRVGEGDHNSERQTFWNSHHNNSDTNNDVVNPLLEILDERTIVFTLASEKVNVTLEDTIEEVTEKEDVNGKESGVGTDFTNLSGDDFELLLEGGLAVSLSELVHDFTEGGLLANHNGKHFTVTTSN